MTFHPKFTLDLSSASTRAFNQLLDDFEVWRAAEAQRDLDLTNGWKTITPEIAESMLLRNPIGANRRPTLQTVKYYARQMLGNAWKKTGQAVIFDANGDLLDFESPALGVLLVGRLVPNLLGWRCPARSRPVCVYRQFQGPIACGRLGNSRTQWPSKTARDRRNHGHALRTQLLHCKHQESTR